MENASKALIIAGAILLSIAIIGVGMFVFTNVQDTITGAADMSADEIKTYNQKFTSYSGNIRGSRAKNLCETVLNHNLSAIDASQKVVLTTGKPIAGEPCSPPQDDGAAGTTTADINKSKNELKSGFTYSVTFGYDANSGLITAVDISEVK